MLRATCLSLLLTGSASMLPLIRGRVGRPLMMAEHTDSGAFLNDPISFIANHPEMFSEDLQMMATYQQMVGNGRLDDWGDLPVALDQVAKGSQALQIKSYTSQDVAQMIVQADAETLQTFVSDARFEEKKVFFERLAQLPPDQNGMLAIHEVASEMFAAGSLPLLASFEEDLERVTAKVNELNAELVRMDETYSTLFLSVRKAAKLAAIAAAVMAR